MAERTDWLLHSTDAGFSSKVNYLIFITHVTSNAGLFLLYFQTKRRASVGSGLSQAWELIHPRSLFSFSPVKGLEKEGRQ